MRPVMPRGWCFFLLAVFLLGGVAIQAAALYLFAIIVPVFLFQSLLRESRCPLGGIGLALLVAYFIFVFNNLLQIPLDNGVGLAASPRGFMVGELSSAVGVSALFLLGFSRLRPRQAAQTQDRCQAGKTMKMFCYGMGAGSFVLFVYGLIQCASGFDFNTLNAYRPDRLLPNGLYRISGFASHPVPFAGVALAVLVFFAYLTAVPPFA